jgi:hypothetical protein
MIYAHMSSTTPTTAIEFAAAVERAEREEAIARAAAVDEPKRCGDEVGNGQGMEAKSQQDHMVARLTEGEDAAAEADADDGKQLGTVKEAAAKEDLRGQAEQPQAVNREARETVCGRVERAHQVAALRKGDDNVGDLGLAEQGKGTRHEPWVIE